MLLDNQLNLQWSPTATLPERNRCPTDCKNPNRRDVITAGANASLALALPSDYSCRYVWKHLTSVITQRADSVGCDRVRYVDASMC
jgi:hypothetical protein